MVGANTWEAGTQSLLASSSRSPRLSLVSREDDEVRDTSDTRIIFIGVKRPKRAKPAVERRQSLQ